MPNPAAMCLCLPSSDPMFAGRESGVYPIGVEQCEARPGLAFRLRSEVEDDPSLRHFASYAIVRARSSGRVLAYRRPSGDPRLLGAVSCGIGGHVEPGDWPSGWLPVPLMVALEGCASRELGEELGIAPWDWQGGVLGLILDNSDPVGSVHAGALVLASIPGERDFGDRPEIGRSWWIKPSILIEDRKLEGWSALALNHLLFHEKLS